MPHSEGPIRSSEVIGLREKCGITAYVSRIGESVPRRLANYQENLRNRGRDSAGIAVFNPDSLRIQAFQGEGSALQVFPQSFDFQVHNLVGDRGISHGRYSTSGKEEGFSLGMQPIVVDYMGKQMAMAFNGNIPDRYRQVLRGKIPREMPTPPNIDTYDIAQAIISAEGDSWEEMFYRALFDIPHAYSLTILTGEGRVFGMRCAEGTWPLWVGEDASGITLASESRVDPKMHWRSLKPGELVEVTQDGIKSTQLFEGAERRCFINDLYLAKQDSLMFAPGEVEGYDNGLTYGGFRREVGREFARSQPIVADMYVGVPETGVTLAQGYAEAMGHEPVEYIVKNDDRTYISPNRATTLEMVDRKYSMPNPNLPADVLDGVKSVVLIDDSVIKGNTMGGDAATQKDGVVQKMRKSGVGEVHIASATPKFINDCDKGVYIPIGDLVAVEYTDDGEYRELDDAEVATKLRADSIRYHTPGGLLRTYEHFIGRSDNVCLQCITGKHEHGEMSPSVEQSTVQPLKLYTRDGEEATIKVAAD